MLNNKFISYIQTGSTHIDLLWFTSGNSCSCPLIDIKKITLVSCTISML